jgi:hypothetical protein
MEEIVMTHLAPGGYTGIAERLLVGAVRDLPGEH